MICQNGALFERHHGWLGQLGLGRRLQIRRLGHDNDVRRRQLGFELWPMGHGFFGSKPWTEHERWGFGFVHSCEGKYTTLRTRALNDNGSCNILQACPASNAKLNSSMSRKPRPPMCFGFVMCPHKLPNMSFSFLLCCTTRSSEGDY